MTVLQLKLLLDTLPVDFSIFPNNLGNFNVYDGTGQYHGYIDINTGHLEVAPEDL